MNKALSTLFALALLSGCGRENDLHLDATAISSIDVLSIEPDGQAQSKQITDRRVINELIACLNHASKELNKFYPSHRLVLHTGTKADSVVVRGRSFRMDDGRRYNATCNIEQLVR